MGNIIPPKNLKLFCAVLYNNSILQPAEIIHELETLFGSTDSKKPEILFKFTDYYNDEMGNTLNKFFVSFENLIEPEHLTDIKIKTNEIEKKLQIKYSTSGRPVNLDPGYLTLANIILLTTKDFSHRIYLGKGIYGEVTLIYKKNGYRFLEWTYPDYKDKSVIEYLLTVRDKYKIQLKSQ